MTKRAVLEATELNKHYGDLHAVRGVSFHIDAGETYGLLGPNGAGKTTTIAMVGGLLENDGGQVLIEGEPMTVRTLDPRRKIGLVPQDLAIYPDLTGRENLTFFAQLYEITGKKLKDRVAAVLEVVGLSDRADDRAGEFSGGMKRRLNIGIGLLHEPRLLILDEPTVGVDPQSRNAILESVEALSAEGMAVLYTTHYMEEAERLATRVGIIDQGEIKAEGTRRQLVQMVGERDRISITANGPLETAIANLRVLSGVEDAGASDGQITLLVQDASELLAKVLETVTNTGASVSSVAVEEPDLEAAFLHLTGKALRD